MCTVTIIPKGTDDFILTSNRDEAPYRKSLQPRFATYKNVSMLFPEDAQSSGTWIGISETNRVLCLLNGGFELHVRQESYRQSRGVVVKDLLSCINIVKTIESYNFKDIEPFTLVVVDWNAGLHFYELVWDGEIAHFKRLPKSPHIWSSSTLYTPTMKNERKQWFEDFKIETELTSETLLNFHKTAGKDNLDYGVIMNRGFVKTTSITQVKKSDTLVDMRYESLQNDETTCVSFNLSKSIHE